MQTPNWTTLDQAITRCKAEILRDIETGVVPSTCASFSELHDHVDANGYGGSFEHEFINDEADFWNAVQDAVHKWLNSRLA